MRGKGSDPTTAASSFEGCNGLAKAFAPDAGFFAAGGFEVLPVAGVAFLPVVVIRFTSIDLREGLPGQNASRPHC